MGAKLLAFSSIPVIDISALRGGDPAAIAATAAEIGRACEEIGFFYIKGHGVPEAVIARAWSLAEAFFALPDEAKRAAAPPAPAMITLIPRAVAVLA